MTPQEIIKEIQNLPPTQRKKVIDSVSMDVEQEENISEAEVAEYFLAKGVISEIPEKWNEADEEFEPIEIKGKPLSETIIEDRD